MLQLVYYEFPRKVSKQKFCFAPHQAQLSWLYRLNINSVQNTLFISYIVNN